MLAWGVLACLGWGVPPVRAQAPDSAEPGAEGRVPGDRGRGAEASCVDAGTPRLSLERADDDCGTGCSRVY